MAPGQCLDPKAPVCCGAVEDFVRDRHLQAHRRKVADSRTLIQNKWSVREEEKIQASRRNVKREQVMDDRFAQIERENSRLLMRMHEIERRGPTKAAAQLAMGGPSCAQVRSTSLPGAGSRAGAHMKELRRIDAENNRLLKRLQGAKSSVDVQKNNESWQKQQKVMRLRLERPNQLAKQEARVANAALKDKFTILPPSGPMDEEFAHLLRLKQHLEESAEPEPASPAESATNGLYGAASDAGDAEPASSSRPATSRSAAAAPAAPAAPASHMFGGVIPARSRAIVEELMALHRDDERRYEDEEEEAAAAKAAAEQAFRAAVAVDVASGGDDHLGYGAFVQRTCAY